MRTVAFWSLLLLLSVSLVFAQTETGQITGTVSDPTGSVVPDAKVTVKNLATGATRNVTTTSAGVYAVANLQPGRYDVSVEFAGFSTAKRIVDVTVGSRVGSDFTLQVGQTGTTVEVTEAINTVNVETQTLGATINTQQVIELPTLTRDPYALVATVGNVSPTSPDARGAGFAINGQRSASTNVMLDGTSNNDEFAAGIGQRVPLDSVQEFSVLTSNFTAEYGRASGGIVNVVTKSGTNQYHGSAYEFNRVSALASNDFDSNANGIGKPVFVRNQFGFSVGGPVIPRWKDKLFFFHNTEWTRIRSQAVSTVWIPTPQFIAASASNTQSFFSTYGKLRSGLVDLGALTKAQLTARGFDPCKGLAATSACSTLAAGTPLLDRVSYGYPSDSGGGTPQNTYSTVSRIDYNMSEKTTMYARYALSSEVDTSGSISNSPYAGFDSPNTQYNNSVVYSLTHTFSPRLISQTKLDFNRFNNQQPFGGYGPVPTLYLGSAATATSILGNKVALPGYLPYSPGNGIPFGGPQNYVQLYEDLTYIKGKHNIRFGGTFTYLRDNRTFGAYETALEVLGNNTPRGIDNFLTGNVYQFQGAVYPQGKFPCGATVTPDCTLSLPVGPPNFSRSNRSKDWGFYAQDSWKISPRVTLNLGVRYEIFGVPQNKDPKLQSNFYLGSGNTEIQRLANGSVQVGKPVWNTDYHNVGPRLGAAWDVFGDGSTSLRGGYGIYYERNFGNVVFNIIQNPPNYAVLSLIAGQDLPSIAISSNNAGPLSGTTGTKSLPKVSLRAVDPNIKTAYAQAWSGSLEHRFGKGLIAALEYSGSYGLNQYGIANFNKAGSSAYYLGTPCDGSFNAQCQTRLVPTQYSNINFRTNGGFDDYNALNFRLETQNIANSGLTFRFNYTWSHAIDTLSDTFSSSGNQANLGWLDPFHPEIDKGDAYYDLRHRVTLAAVYAVPFKSSSKVVDAIAGGWTLTPLFTAYTGSPYSLYDCTNAATVCPYASFTGAVPSSPTSSSITATATPNIYSYLNVSSSVDSTFVNPKIGVSDFGPFPSNMIGRNFFRTPGFWNLDFAVHKNFRFGEVKRLQFRAEAYNVFNHANLFTNTGDNDVSSIDFVSASYGGRRNVQLGIRFDF